MADRHVRDAAFFLFLWFAVAVALFFFVLYQEMRCYLRMKTAESLCIGNFFFNFHVVG